MTLKGKAETDNLIARISEIYSSDRCTPILSYNSSPSKGWGYVAKNVLRSRWTEDEEGKKQGVAQHFNYFQMEDALLPGQEEQKGDSNRPTRSFVRYLERTVSYKDNIKDGPEVVYYPSGKLWSYTPYEEGKKSGLAFVVDSTGKTHYSLYLNGELVAEDPEIRKMWKENVEGLKYEKEVDKEARQSTLKALLKANSREEKLDILDKFHSEKAPVPRRSSSPIHRAMTLNKLKGGPDMDI